MNNLLMPNMIVLAIELVFLSLVYIGLVILLHLLEKKSNVVAMRKQMSQHILSGVKMIRRAFNLLFIGIFLGVIGFNSWKIYQGIDLQQDTLVLFSRISPDFWANLIQNTGISIAVFFIARYLIGLIDKGLIKLRTVVLNYKNIQSNNESINIFFQRLSRMQGTVIGILVIYGLSRQFGLPGSISVYLIIALNIYLVISISLLFVSAVAVVVESLDALSKYYADSRGLMVFYNRLKHLVPLLRRTLDYIIYVAVATLVITQLEFIAEFARYGPGIIQGIGVFFLSRVGVEVINLLIDRTAIHGDISEKECQRNQTIFPIIKSILATLVYFCAIVIVMKGLGFDPIPLLAGAGVLGLVVGFGTQSLINDLVSGFFIIFEYTFQVGDYVEVNKASGVVESIGLRTTSIRSDNGELHILQNGKLGDVVNHSHEYTNAVVNVGVSYKTDLQQVYAVLNDLGKVLHTEMDDVLKPTEVAGVVDFSGPEIIIRTVTRVRPGRHKPIAREIRRRIIDKFQEQGIVIPFKNRFKFA
jgi:moderate conductance mechanosensitive channel